MITPRIEIICLGYRNSNPLKIAWSAILIATAPDGREKRKEIAELLPDYTKNQADIVSVTKALQCVKPEYRAKSEVVLYAPPGYAYQMLEKGPDGMWSYNPKQNMDIIQAARDMINKYSKIEIRKPEQYGKLFKDVIQLVKSVQVQPSSEGVKNE